MATAQDLLNLLEPKLLGYQDALTPAGLTPATENLARKIHFLNEGWHAAWRALTGIDARANAHWFAKDDTVTVTAGNYDVNLPADFHDMIFVSPADAAYQHIVMKKIGMHQPRFKSDRQSNLGNFLNTDVELYYSVTYGDPGSLRLARSSPGADFDIIYRYRLPNITAANTNIDDMPEPYRPPITDYAAAGILNAVHEPELAQHWWNRWVRAYEEMQLAGSKSLDPSMDVGTEDFGGMRSSE